MSAKHTPGPWRLHAGWPVQRGHIGISAEGHDYLAQVVVRMEDDEFDAPALVANAHLIAAAPDLLSVLADLLEAADSMRATFGCIQGRHPEEDDTHIHEKWAEDFLKERADEARAAIAKATGGTQ